jgi:hypothetical protein
MSTTTSSPQPLATTEGRGSIVRPRFTPGLLLLDEDLSASVDYTRELTRLLFRNLFGCGVMCGLTVDGQEASQRCLTVTVQPGLALDCMGDPVQVQQAQSLTIKADCDKTLPSSVVVAVRRCEHHCMPRELACPPEAGGQSAAKTRSIDCYEIGVFQGPNLPADACGCSPQTTTTTTNTPAPAQVNNAPTVSGATGGAVPERASPATTVARDQLALQAVVAPVLRRARTEGNGFDVAECYLNDILGKCNCGCCTGCEWVVIAALARPGSAPTNTGGSAAGTQQTMITWTVDYSVSRYIRPVLLGELGQERI